MNVYFTSDTHFGHKNIVRGTTEWENARDKVRDFDTLEEHNQVLIDNINGMVKENDILYHLGDWSFGGIENIWEFRRQINCRNIHLILGNHDHHIEQDRSIRLLGKEIPENNPCLIVTAPQPDEYTHLRIRDFFRSIDHYKEISFKIDSQVSGRYGKTKIVLCHFALSVWNNAHHGAIHLYGHSHGSLPDRGNRSMDVGVDTNNLYPYHLDEIISIMKNRPDLRVDHHSELTN